MRQVSFLMLIPIKIYQKCISPFLPPACRFDPTCSQYLYEAIVRKGPVRGSILGFKRILRCHPWSSGGPDPVR